MTIEPEMGHEKKINATKIEKIVYYTRFIRHTVTLVVLEHSSTNDSCHNQASYKTRRRIYYF
jgi:hypothetical protein